MDSPFLGMIQYFAFDFTPKYYANCNGALLAIAQNQALFALLGTTYGGNGVQTFALPDLRGRAVVGQSNSHTMGEKYGAPSVTMLTSNMPMHTHSSSVQIAVNNTAATTNNPTAGYPAIIQTGSRSSFVPSTMYASAPDANTYLGAPTVIVGTTGQNVPFSTQNPYLAVTACIAMQGIFPSRN